MSDTTTGWAIEIDRTFFAGRFYFYHPQILIPSPLSGYVIAVFETREQARLAIRAASA